MKYLIFVFLFIFGSSTLTAQDTLYVKGKRKPLIVNITIVKKKSLNYTKKEGELIYTIKMKNIKKIKFHNATETTIVSTIENSSSSSSSSSKKVQSDFEEFRSTISINSIGTGRHHVGLNYLHKINSKSERHKYFLNIGSGYYNRQGGLSGFDVSRAKGYYLELGARLEIRSKQNPQNRFHIGLDLNNRRVKKGTNTVNENEFNVQIPLGYTLRTNEGFYLNTGLELTTEKIFPAFHVGLGIAFGR